MARKKNTEPGSEGPTLARSALGTVYARIITQVFRNHHTSGCVEFTFDRSELEAAGRSLGIQPKNLGDLIYTFRYRQDLPPTVRRTAPEGKVWYIAPAGRAK